jgi:hypothetical protein
LQVQGPAFKPQYQKEKSEVVHACNPSIQEAEASLGYIVRPWLDKILVDGWMDGLMDR